MFVKAMRKRKRVLESQQVLLVVCPSLIASNIRQIILFWLSVNLIPLFGAESFVFQVAFQKFKDQDI